jgi:uncharacterized membrane protein
MILLLAFLIGLFTGLRSLTPPAITAWAARLGWLKLHSPLAWIGSTWAAGLYTLLALGELVADKLPKTPSRTALPSLIARIVMGGLCASCIAMTGELGNQGLIIGTILGIVGALVGCFGGYQVRKRLVKTLGTPDYVVALVEDAITIGGSLWVVTRF